MVTNQKNDNQEETVSHDNLPGSSTDKKIDNKEMEITQMQNDQEIDSKELTVEDPESTVYETSNLSREPREIVKIQGTNTKKTSLKRIQEHYVSHLPHATWCRFCVEGRMV